MAILVGENYKITADRLNVILHAKRGKAEVDLENDNEDKVEKGWYICGYFGNLTAVFKRLTELEVRKADLVDLQTVAEAEQKLYDLIDRVCPKITISELRKAKKGEVKDESDDSD